MTLRFETLEELEDFVTYCLEDKVLEAEKFLNKDLDKEDVHNLFSLVADTVFENSSSALY